LKFFAAEKEILRKIRHRNILKLYASLLKGGSSFLVFKYMPNGNLFQALHRRIKDWYQRYKIALGDAKGIAYLHDDGSPPIIHRDIKSSDILLDEDMNQKLLTLGLRNLQKCPLRGVIVAHLLALMAILFLESLKLLFLQDCCLISTLSHGNIIFSYPMLIITANFFCEIL
jgi:serine/threonine protein kinase